MASGSTCDGDGWPSLHMVQVLAVSLLYSGDGHVRNLWVLRLAVDVVVFEKESSLATNQGLTTIYECLRYA